VVHSFWIPAFRMKIDAVPGLWTTAYVTPEDTGSTKDTSVMRLQCAEMCGFGHFAMRAGVRVVEQADFDAWVAEMKSKQN
jgi:cytochrome c oxidase subunit 2